jgi:hypothetical protein
MLKFYGIRFNQNGNPERFTLTFALGESLHAGLKLSNLFNGDPDKTAKAVDHEIEKMFRSPEAQKNSKHFRFLVARWFRTRDIIRFLFADKETEGLKIETAHILCTGDEIETKWQKIELLLLDYLDQLSVETRNEQLSNPDSELNLTLQMVSLFFLEQDDELPPANLEMQFIRNQFPRIIWKKKDGFNASSNPFWSPENMYCRSAYLAANLISKTVNSNGNPGDSFLPVDISANSFPGSTVGGVSLNSLLPEAPPDELRVILEDEEEDNQQLVLIPESASETLLSLQKMIQKRLSHEGVKHLLGILRQFASATSDGYCVFNSSEHFKLVARAGKGGVFSKKQVHLFKEVFTLLSRVKVKRSWNQTGQEKKVTVNPFVLELYSECADPSGCSSLKHLMLDPLFLPVKNSPFRLGGHLGLIPSGLFRESASKHALLPGIASYLAGTWMNEYLLSQGAVTKSTREIIEGCAFNVTSASRYRIVDKVKSELAYMKEKCYISEYRHQSNEDGNPWDDLHSITAPEAVLANLAEKMRAIDANSISEKLIA